MERRNITLEKRHLDILSPLLEKNQGNISASIRDVIDFADLMIKSYGSLENAINDAVSSEKIEGQRVGVDQTIWQWLLESSRGILPPNTVIENLYEFGPDFDLKELINQINDTCIKLGWKTRTKLYEPMTYIFSGGSENQRELILKLVCLYLLKKNMGIDHKSNTYSLTKVDFAIRNNYNEAYKDYLIHLGYLDKSIKEIKSRPEFWNMLINTTINTDYQMVTIHRKNYENLISGNTRDDTDIFSVFTGLPIGDINLQRLLPLIKSVFETSRIVDRIEIDQDSLKIFHSFSNKDAIETICRTILKILEQNGYSFETLQATGIIILQHKTEIEGRISELVENLLSAKGSFNHELMTFLIFLDGVKDKNLISTSVKDLGMSMGEHILMEYEKEFEISDWDLEKFKDVFSEIDRKLGRESVLELIDPNVMHYVVNKCQIVHQHGKFNIHLCNLTHGLLKGAVDYVFKGDAMIKPKKMIGSGDSLCEFYIAMGTKLRMPDDKSYEL